MRGFGSRRLRGARLPRALVLLVAVQALAVLVSRAAAAGASEHSVAIYVEGADAKATRRDIVGALSDSISVVDEGRTEGALRAAGVKGHVAELVSKEEQREKAAAKVRKAASRLGAGAILVASVPKGKGDRDILVLVVRGKNDVMFDTVTIDSKEGRASKSSKWQSFVAAAIPDADASPPEKPAAEAEPASEPPAAPPEAAAEPAAQRQEPGRDTGSGSEPKRNDASRFDRALAVMGVGYDAMTRSFSYKDPVTSNLRPYDVVNTPGIAASVELYPLARSRGKVLPDLGIAARMARAFAFDSSPRNGQGVSTTWQDVEVGIRGRIHTGAPGVSPLLGLGAAYSSSVFAFDGSPSASDLPSARYKMLRAEVDGRVPFGSFAALAEASYLQVLDVSPMSDRFTRESVHGVGGRVGMAVRALPWLEGRLELRYDHLFYKLSPEPGDQYVAGGALDQRFSVSAGAYAYF